MPKQTHDEIRTQLATEMRQHDLVRMVATFYGSGDEGTLDRVEWSPTISAATSQLEILADRYAWSVIHEAGMAGFENNEGGGGEITLDLINRTEGLNAYYYVEATEQGPTYEQSISVRAPGARLNRRRRLGHGRQRR